MFTWWRATASLGSVLGLCGFAGPLRAAEGGLALPLEVVAQAYDFQAPWAKKLPVSFKSAGVLLPGGVVLTTAPSVADATRITGRTAAGSVISFSVRAVDYDVGLALLAPDAPGAFSNAVPWAVDATAETNRAVEILGWSSADERLPPARGKIIEFRMSESGECDRRFLYGIVESALAPNPDYQTAILTGQGRVCGLLLPNTLDQGRFVYVSGYMIAQFLGRINGPEYSGFPDPGLAYMLTTDPAFRKYLGLEGRPGEGVYVTTTWFPPDGPPAALLPGDVLVSLNGAAIGDHGDYADPDLSRRMPLDFFLNCKLRSGEPVDWEVIRQGQILRRRTQGAPPPSKSGCRDFLHDEEPDYCIVGGLLFQPLTRQFLMEWGSQWFTLAPQPLVYLDQAMHRDQNLRRKGVLVLTRFLPLDCNVGYENTMGGVVTRVNNLEVHSVADLRRALTRPVEGFHKLEFTRDPKIIYISVQAAKASEEELKTAYGIKDLFHEHLH